MKKTVKHIMTPLISLFLLGTVTSYADDTVSNSVSNKATIGFYSEEITTKSMITLPQTGEGYLEWLMYLGIGILIVVLLYFWYKKVEVVTDED